ncbi:MAG: hypothetical protein AAFX80_01885 [Cyanobacteria bacterium J06639_18]
MLQSRWLQLMKYFQYFRLEFWFSLPLLGLVFWLFCGWMTQELLINLSNEDIKPEISVKPQSNSYLRQFSSIVLQVNSGKGFSMVTATKEIRGEKTRGVKKIEFQLFTTDLQEIEAEIAKELELPPRKVRKLLVN